jgi:hypothetical protein
LKHGHKQTHFLNNPSGWVIDHDPAHVHVFGDGQAKINLVGPGGAPELVWAEGMKRNEVRRAFTIVAEN